MNREGQRQHDAICEAANGRPSMVDFWPLDKSLYPEAYPPKCRIADDPGRLPTNLEMNELLARNCADKWERIECDGCCGGAPMADGICFGIGQCPRFLETKRCQSFVAKYLEWLDQINEPTALAAIAARLEMLNSFEPETSDVV